MKDLFCTKTYIKILFTGLVLFVAIHSAYSQKSKVRMAFIGNSITAGVYDYGKSNLNVSYASQFRNLMYEVYGDTLETFNAGVSGRTLTKNGPAPIWKESAFANALAFKPDICLIALGTNDSKPSLYDLVQNEFYSDYQDMINTFRNINPNTTFIVCLPPPIWEGHPYSATDPHNDTLLLKYTIPLIDSIAKENNLYVVDFHTPFTDKVEYFTDHLHPNIEGHKAMAKILFDRVIEEGIMEQFTATSSSVKFKTYHKVMVFPNPSEDKCTLQIPDDFTGAADVNVLDANGVPILSFKNIQEKMCSIDVSSLTEGMYYIKIKSGDMEIIEKLLIK